MLLTRLRIEIDSFSRWFTVALIAIFALYLSLWFFTIQTVRVQENRHIVPTLPVVPEDSQEYADLVQSMLSGNGFAMQGRLETLRTPGYPVFAATIKRITGTYFAVTLAQIFVVLLAAIIVRRIGMFVASRHIGEIAAVLLLLNPVTVTLTLLIYSDILFLLLFACGVYTALTLHLRRFLRGILLTSLFFGLAIYVRPIGVLAAPIFIAPLLASKLSASMKWKAVSVLLISLILIISPWMARNYVRTGVFSYTSIGASGISWAVARFLANADHVPLEDAYHTLEDKIGSPQSTWRDIRLSSKISGVSDSIIFERPFSYLAYHITTGLPFLFPSTIAFALDIYNDSIGQSAPFSLGAIHYLAAGDVHSFIQGVMQVWWKLLERVAWFGICLIALITVWYRRRDPPVWAFVVIIGYLLLLAGPAAGPRYSLQAWPYLFILFASGCAYLSEKVRYRRASK